MLKKRLIILATAVGLLITYGDRLLIIVGLCEFINISICSEPIEPCSSKADTIDCVKDLFNNPNLANLKVEILPDSSFKLNETMKMRFISEKEGQLLVFDINSDGALTLLMPNQYYNDGFKLKANKEFIIPEKHWSFYLPAQEPIGKGSLLTILIEDEIDLKSILPVSFEALNAEMAKPILQHLHDQLKKEVMLDGVLRPRKWSGVFSDYEIHNK